MLHKQLARPSWEAEHGGTQGSVLLSVLIISMLGSLLVISLLYTVRVEYSASGQSQRTQQAWAAALSGVQRAVWLASRFPFEPERWRDNPDELQAQLVASDGVEDWYFTVYAPGADEGNFRYGVSDEGAKFNVQALDLEFLQTLPGVTPELAAALLDYADTDSEPTADGAEQDYYSDLRFPYEIANGPLTSLDELLLVRGLDAGRLYGEDANLNRRLDRSEDDGDESFPPDNGDGELARGLDQYLTVWSTFWEVDAAGAAKLPFNSGPDLVASLGLPKQLGAFLACAEEAGTAFEHPVDLFEQSCVPANTESSTAGEEGEAVAALESGVGLDELAVLLDRTNFREEESHNGPHVNVLTASQSVLALVPGLDAATAESIVRKRENLEPDQRRTTAWLLGSEIVDVQTYRKIAPWLVPRSFQFRVRVIGYGIRSGVYRILEVVIDLGGARPRLVYLRDLTRLGPSFPIADTEEDLG